MRLDRFDNSTFDRGRPWWVEALWRTVDGLLVRSWLPGSAWRVTLLRLFGAQVGPGAVIKPRVRITFPWKLRLGAHCWLGEQAWIDNLAEVRIGDHCCISQGAYLCTGNHRWDREAFDLAVGPIVLEDHCWIGAMARVGPGVVCRAGAVLTLGSVAVSDLAAWQVHSGAPARAVQDRAIENMNRD